MLCQTSAAGSGGTGPCRLGSSRFSGAEHAFRHAGGQVIRSLCHLLGRSVERTGFPQREKCWPDEAFSASNPCSRGEAARRKGSPRMRMTTPIVRRISCASCHAALHSVTLPRAGPQRLLFFPPTVCWEELYHPAILVRVDTKCRPACSVPGC